MGLKEEARFLQSCCPPRNHPHLVVRKNVEYLIEVFVDKPGKDFGVYGINAALKGQTTDEQLDKDRRARIAKGVHDEQTFTRP